MPPSPTRVDAIVETIPHDARAMADIGYDLGRIALAALARRPALRIVGVEIQPASAARVAATMIAEGVPPGIVQRFEPRTGDGLSPLEVGEVEGVLMAGLGERTMLSALDRRPDVAADLRWLVLCPSHLESCLRPGLVHRGWGDQAATLVLDRGRFYEVITARRGDARAPSGPVEAAFGADLLTQTEPELALAFLRDLQARFGDAIAAGLRSYDHEPDKRPLAAKLRALPAAIEAVEARLAATH